MTLKFPWRSDLVLVINKEVVVKLQDLFALNADLTTSIEGRFYKSTFILEFIVL